MDHQQRQQQKQITQLQPSNLQIVKENISQEEVESPMLPLAMTTSHTKNVNVLHFDEILKEHTDDFGLPSLNILQLPNNFSPKANDVKQDEILESRSDIQIQEQQPNNFKNLSNLLGAADLKPISKHRSLSGAIRPRTLSHACCLSTTSAKNKIFPNRKAKTNTKQTTKSDRTMLLGVKRAPSDLNQIIDKNWIASYVEIDLSSQYKRKRLNDDSFLKDSKNDSKKPTNQAMIKAIDSDDAMDYLRVRKQKGVSKINIKKANVFDKIIPQQEVEEQQIQDKQILNIQMQQQDIFSDDSSIMGDKWYDKKDVDFKFEITSNVDSIEFPMNQNLNLKLNLKSQDGEQIQQNNDIDFESPKSIKHQFQFTGEKVDLNLQIQNDNKLQQQEMPVKSDMKALQLQKFTLSNIKPFDQLLDVESSENENLQ